MESNLRNFGTQSSLQGKIELDFEAANDLIGDIGTLHDISESIAYIAESQLQESGTDIGDDTAAYASWQYRKYGRACQTIVHLASLSMRLAEELQEKICWKENGV